MGRDIIIRHCSVPKQTGGHNTPHAERCHERNRASIAPSLDLLLTGGKFFHGLIMTWLTAGRGPDKKQGRLSSSKRKWIGAVRAQTADITPGSPWENVYIESFNARLRDEFLNGEIFYTLQEAKILIEAWRRQYDTIRYGRIHRLVIGHQRQKY